MSTVIVLVEGVFSLLVLVTIYDVFFGDVIANRLRLKKKAASTKSNVEKLARVKSISDDPKDIEKFITDNAQYLSPELVEQLVCRIELVKADRVIDNDNILKTRIDALESPQIEEARYIEATLPKAKAKRK